MGNYNNTNTSNQRQRQRQKTCHKCRRKFHEKNNNKKRFCTNETYKYTNIHTYVITLANANFNNKTSHLIVVAFSQMHWCYCEQKVNIIIILIKLQKQNRKGDQCHTVKCVLSSVFTKLQLTITKTTTLAAYLHNLIRRPARWSHRPTPQGWCEKYCTTTKCLQVNAFKC